MLNRPNNVSDQPEDEESSIACQFHQFVTSLSGAFDLSNNLTLCLNDRVFGSFEALVVLLQAPNTCHAVERIIDLPALMVTLKHYGKQEEEFLILHDIMVETTRK